MRQMPLDLHERPAPTLENFVPGANAEALALAARLREGERPVRFVYLWGPHGAGKSHLLRALGARAETNVPDTLDAGELVMVDDCEQLDARAQQKLFSLYNRIQAGVDATLLVTGSQPPLAIGLREDLRNRLGWGLVLQLRLLDDSQKAAALAAHARERGVTIAPDLIRHLLVHHERDIRSLTALFDALDRYAFEQKRALSLKLLRDFEAERGRDHGDPPAAC